MKSRKKSTQPEKIDIQDYYAFRLKLIWEGFKQAGPAFWTLCAYIFFEYVRPQSLYPVIDVLPFTQIFLLLSCLFAFADRNIKWVSNPGNIVFTLFVIIVILSSVLAFRPSASYAKIDIIINWVVVYFLFIAVVNTEKKFIMFLLMFFVVNFKMSQFGFRNFITQGYTSVGVSGAPGWFRDAGDLGIEMLIFVSLSGAVVLALKEHWGRYTKLLAYLMPLTAVITIIATASRGAQLGLIVIGIWFLIKSRNGIKGIAGILIVGLMFYALLPEEMFDEFKAAGEDNTSQNRLALWGFGGDVVRSHPVLGVGYYNWLDYCNYKNPHGLGTNDHCLVAHNTYVTAVAELGITGLVSYLTLMLFIFILNARTRNNAKKNNNKFILYTAHGLDGGLIGFMIQAIFFTVLFYPMLYVQLAMTVALNEISKDKVVGRFQRRKQTTSQQSAD